MNQVPVIACFLAGGLALAGVARAQEAQVGSMKSLSEEQVQAYLEGRGMGMGMAAEANGYPGPMHVLELADSLNLSEEQRQRTATAFAQVKSEAQRLGREIVAQEQALEALFVTGAITEDGLASATKRLGELQGELRHAHLRAHLSMAEILTAEQRRRYSELRGHSQGQGGEHRHQMQHDQMHHDQMQHDQMQHRQGSGNKLR
ncbi:MAG: periplasmic heavy metal sensor [Gemmatimonadota bacterium]|nr:MAG: periplasmic heavy metal sensor [Gemmatimonadota bacterium]